MRSMSRKLREMQIKIEKVFLYIVCKHLRFNLILFW